MNKTRKAMLAFIIFGFFGGCKAANVIEATHKTWPSITLKANHLREPGAVYNGERYKLDTKQDNTRNVILPNGQQDRVNVNSLIIKKIQDNNAEVGTLFTYHRDYENLILTFLNNVQTEYDGKKIDITDENKLCQELLRFFLVDEPNKLMEKYKISKGTNIVLYNKINQIRNLFYWHISKHYTSFKDRSSNGVLHTFVNLETLPFETSQSKHIGELTLSSNKFNALRNMLDEVTTKCAFKFNDRSIEMTTKHNYVLKLNTFKDKDIVTYPIDGQTRKIQINDNPTKQNENIERVYFGFKLLQLIDIANFQLSMAKCIEGDGIFGSFYLEVRQ